MQSVPQLIPLGLDVTAPLPVPAFDTVNVYCGTMPACVTVTVSDTPPVPVAVMLAVRELVEVLAL